MVKSHLKAVLEKISVSIIFISQVICMNLIFFFQDNFITVKFFQGICGSNIYWIEFLISFETFEKIFWRLKLSRVCAVPLDSIDCPDVHLRANLDKL